jgi:hypothetical protein
VIPFAKPDVKLVPPLATGNVPVTPVVKLTAGIVTVALDASNVAPLGILIVSPDAPIVIVSAFH